MFETQYHQRVLENDAFLVTGCAGFIGSNLCEYLLRNGAGLVKGLDNFATGYKDNLTRLQKYPNFHFTEGDIKKPADCMIACENTDFVLHQAALGSVPRSIENPAATNETNVSGFINMVQAARTQGVKRFVFASSSSVYGDTLVNPRREDILGRQLSPYAVSKYANELYAYAFREVYGFGYVGLRYFNVYGPYQNTAGAYAAVIPHFIQKIMTGEPVNIHGDGAQSRDFTFIENVIQANIKAVFAGDAALNKVYNIGQGGRCTINQLYKSISAILGREVPVQYAETRQGDVNSSVADIHLATNLLGYLPGYSLEEGLAETVQFYQHNK